MQRDIEHTHCGGDSVMDAPRAFGERSMMPDKQQRRRVYLMRGDAYIIRAVRESAGGQHILRQRVDNGRDKLRMVGREPMELVVMEQEKEVTN